MEKQAILDTIVELRRRANLAEAEASQAAERGNFKLSAVLYGKRDGLREAAELLHKLIKGEK